MLAATLAALSLAACGGSTPLQTTSARGFPLGDVTVQRGDKTVLTLTVEIADSEKACEQGLMGVKQLADDQGMAFVWTAEQNARFWMKDTLIPLDIVFWRKDGTVVDTQSMTPCTADPCPIYGSQAPYIASVEVRGGLLAKVGLKTGDVVHFTRRAKT
jgi:uncharacterized membrane protein (UPF0127 family)